MDNGGFRTGYTSYNKIWVTQEWFTINLLTLVHLSLWCVTYFTNKWNTLLRRVIVLGKIPVEWTIRRFSSLVYDARLETPVSFRFRCKGDRRRNLGDRVWRIFKTGDLHIFSVSVNSDFLLTSTTLINMRRIRLLPLVSVLRKVFLRSFPDLKVVYDTHVLELFISKPQNETNRRFKSQYFDRSYKLSTPNLDTVDL